MTIKLQAIGSEDAPLAPHHYPENVQIGVPAEIYPNERRVALTPASVEQLRKKGYRVVVEEGAGVASKVAMATFLFGNIRKELSCYCHPLTRSRSPTHINGRLPCSSRTTCTARLGRRLRAPWKFSNLI